jgi:hypothetical protein
MSYGKEQLFIMVTERGLARHSTGIAEAVNTAQPSLPAHLRAIAQWLLRNTPVNFDRMYHSDMPAIAPAKAERLSRLAYHSIIAPIRQVVPECRNPSRSNPYCTCSLTGRVLAHLWVGLIMKGQDNDETSDMAGSPRRGSAGDHWSERACKHHSLQCSH